MATAFALPDSFPQRDTVVLTAFCVVIATLVLQGLTLAPLVKLLKLDRSSEAVREEI
jgi:CPA1 family monovalent cation:H+ antiporter